MQRPARGLALALLVVGLAVAGCGSSSPKSAPATTAEPTTTTTTTAPQLGTRVAASAAVQATGEQAARTMLAAFVADDWGRIYDLSDAAIQRVQTRAAFVASMTTHTPSKVVAGQLAGVGQEQVKQGVVYWAQPVHIQIKSPGAAAKPFFAYLSFLEQAGQWKFVNSTNPTPVK